MATYEEMHGKDEQKESKWPGFRFIHETLKRREPACMGIYEEMHGKKEKVCRECQGYKCKGYRKRNIKVIFCGKVTYLGI